MGLTSIMNRLGDMFMPKELAPYMGTIAPLIAPLSLTASLALGQLGSAKMNDGKLDPYTAAASFMAGNTPQARETRMRGRIDPSQGNMGQRLSGRFSNYLSGTGLNDSDLGKGIIRGIDPTRSMMMQTSGLPGESYYESPAMAGAFNAETSKDPSIDIFREYPQKTAESLFDQSFESDMATRYGSFKTDEEITKLLGGKDSEKGKVFEKLNAIEKDTYRKTLSRQGKGPQKFFGDVMEGASEFAMPGFTDANDNFDYVLASRTIGTASTLGNMMEIKEKIKKEKLKNKAEEQKIYRDWFEQYKRVTGRDYADSPYPDKILIEQYNNIYNANGGRIGYNVGGSTGIIAAAPGMPQGMQLDGREGMFISQGIEEKADDVPAMLSKNEFVLTADSMAGLDKMNGGSGDPRAAAKQMYQIMDQLEAMA